MKNKERRTELTVPMRGANGLAAASRLALAMRIKVVKKIMSGTLTAESFVQYLESQMERHEGGLRDGFFSVGRG